MARLLVLSLIMLPMIAFAEPTTMVIPEQKWQLSFDAPPLAKQRESNQPGQYMYLGNSDRFTLSLYVETPGCKGGTTHEEFYECFWPKASRNPTIIKESVKKTCGPNYCKVMYDVQAPWEGRFIKQRNISFLIAYHGKWTDLHVSVVEPTENDFTLLDTFERSLSYSEGH